MALYKDESYNGATYGTSLNPTVSVPSTGGRFFLFYVMYNTAVSPYHRVVWDAYGSYTRDYNMPNADIINNTYLYNWNDRGRLGCFEIPEALWGGSYVVRYQKDASGSAGLSAGHALVGGIGEVTNKGSINKQSQITFAADIGGSSWLVVSQLSLDAAAVSGYSATYWTNSGWGAPQYRMVGYNVVDELPLQIIGGRSMAIGWELTPPADTSFTPKIISVTM